MFRSATVKQDQNSSKKNFSTSPSDGHRHGKPLDGNHDLHDDHRHSHIPPEHPRAAMPKDSYTLAEQKAGRWGTVFHVGGESALRRRLLDMGLTPGTDILLRKVAPLGDPMEICLRGYELSLRKDDARQIIMIPKGRVIK